MSPRWDLLFLQFSPQKNSSHRLKSGADLIISLLLTRWAIMDFPLSPARNIFVTWLTLSQDFTHGKQRVRETQNPRCG